MPLNNSYYEICVAVVIVFLIAIVNFRSKRKANIPGPFCLPIVGYLPFLSDEPHKKFMQLGKKFGNVFSIQLGLEDVVVLNDWPAIKEAFSKEETLSRPKKLFFTIFNNFESGGSLDGNDWKEQRRFSNRTLKDLGAGKTKMEEHIEEAVGDLCRAIDEQNGEPEHLLRTLIGATLNVMLAYLMGKRFSETDEDFAFILNTAVPEGDEIGVLSFGNFFPNVVRILALMKVSGLEKYKELIYKITRFAEHHIAEHEEQFMNGEDADDFIARYLCEFNLHKEVTAKTSIYRGRLVGNIVGYIQAGVDTVGIVVAWILLLFCEYPECQHRVKNEIESIIGNRMPTLLDRKLLVYTQAFIYEVQRWTAFLPINLPRRAMRDMTIQGYKIKKDTQLIANFYAVHKDENTWKNANDFIPERFISEDGKKIVNTEPLLTFSYGKRSCPGEQMANAELFLITTHLLQKYDVSTKDGEKPSFDYYKAVTLAPKHLNIKFSRRH